MDSDKDNLIKHSVFRRKVLRIFLAISIIPLLITSSLSYFIIVKTRQKNIAELQNLAVNNAYEKISKHINQKMEGLNLVVSGKSGNQSLNIPVSLEEVDPNNLIFLIKKRWQAQNGLNNIETINFLNQSGDIILQINKKQELILKKYYADATTIIHENVSVANNIYDPDFSASGFDFSAYPAGCRLAYRDGNPVLSVAAPIYNQSAQPIGTILTEVNYSEVMRKIEAPIAIEKAAASLKDIEPENLFSILKDYRRQTEERLKGFGDKPLVIRFYDRDGSGLLQADDAGRFTLKVYSEVKTLDSSIQFDDGKTITDADISADGFRQALAGNSYLGATECKECYGEAGKILAMAHIPVKNSRQAVIGLAVIGIDSGSIGANMQNAKLGDATKHIADIDPNNLIYLLRSLKQSIGPDNSVLSLKFIDSNGDVLAIINPDDSIAIKKGYWLAALPDNKILDAYMGGVSEVDSVAPSSAEAPDFRSAIYGNDYFGPLEIADKKPVMALASQFENSDRERIGVVSAKIDLSPIQDTIEEIPVGNTGFIYITDESGKAIASTNIKFAKPGDDLSDIKLVADVLAGNVHDGYKSFDVYNNALGQKAIFIGAPMAKLNQDENLKWSVISEWPRDDAFSAINAILQASIYITLATLALIIILASFFSRQIVKPIKSLVHAAQEISKGNLDYKITLRTKDEFDILSARFNEMVEILKENRKLRDEFVFISAHELRTPVTAIKGYLSMILDNSFGEVPEAIKTNLDIVNASNERLVQLVNDLLEIARSEAGKMKIDMVPTPINENIQTVLNELKSLSDKKNIKVTYDDKLASTIVNADPYKLKEVLTNLIGNAIKYTVGNGAIDITHELQDNHLVVHIKDHGLGMAPEDVKKLFAKFYRVQTKETATIEGTGLGLFICKEIVERMNGKIWVESEVGVGSTFSFSLELAPKA